MTVANPSNYWISSNALRITLNANGDADYIQGNTASGAMILCYIKNVDGLGYDAGHNYQRWKLLLSPTFFPTKTAKYVYVAIPRADKKVQQDYAQVVFPSELLDIYGKNASEQQIGTTDYYYIWLQGIISASEVGGVLQDRVWTEYVQTGTLASDEAYDAGGENTWWRYSYVDDIVTFLKGIVMDTHSWFENIRLGRDKKNIVGVANDTTEETNDDRLVTPKQVIRLTKAHYLNSDEEDIAQEQIGFLKGLWIKTKGLFGFDEDGNAKVNDFNAAGDADILGDLGVNGDATIDGILKALEQILTNRIQSDNFNGDGPFDTGFELIKDDGTGYSYAVVDKLYVRLKAIFNELEIRKISYAGGNFIFSHAGSTIIAVKPTSGAWRCYMKADDGTTSTENWWHVNDQARCQEFGVQEPGVYQDFETRYYWRKVVAVGHENIALEEGQEPGEYNYVDLSVTDCESGSDEPKAGDRIVQMGNRTDLDRQGFISLEVDGEYAPAFKVYKNVNSYDLNNKRKICLSPKYTELRLQKLVIETEYDAKPVKIFRGAWSNITNHRCYYYDEVTHNDETWYCTFPESGIGGVKYTTEEPSDNAQYWVKEVAKGKDGKDGNSFNILGSYNTMAELIAEHPTGNVGNAYIVGSDLVVWDAENNRWKDVGQFKGDTGRGIASVVISYGKSSSSTVLPTTWVASVSDLDLKAGDYLFTRTIYRYDSGTPATSDPVYTIGYIGKDGKDGEGLPAAVLNLSDSVVEIETDENGAATKAFREEITYDMKASGKILYVKNISVPSASHVSVPSYYLSPLKQNAITVSGKVATMMGTVSGTVLTLNQKPDITRLPHIIVSANAGATISEGNVTLNGTAVDKDGKTYEAMNIFVIGRQYYAPALQVVLSQDTIILTQGENTKLIDLTGAYTNVSLRIGGTDITEGLAITVAAEHCNASVIDNTVKIDAILTEEGVYYDRGYVDITISYKGKSYLKRWPFYCNLLGTWKESVENDTKEAIAQSTWWDLDESGNIVESERLGNFVQSSKENTARLEELNYVAVYTGTEKSFTLTAEQITKYGKNYRLVMDYACSSERVTINVKKGSTVIATFTNVLSYDTFDKELTNLSAGTYTITFSQTVTVGRIDVFAVSTNKFSEISQTVDKINLEIRNGLESTGIDIENGLITLDAGTVQIKNGDSTAALFTNGKIKADYIDAVNIVSTALTSQTITAIDATIKNITIEGSSVFRGTIYAVDGEFTGKITATDGTIGGFKISANQLSTTKDGKTTIVSPSEIYFNSGVSSVTISHEGIELYNAAYLNVYNADALFGMKCRIGTLVLGSQYVADESSLNTDSTVVLPSTFDGGKVVFLTQASVIKCTKFPIFDAGGVNKGNEWHTNRATRIFVFTYVTATSGSSGYGWIEFYGA